MTQLKIAKGVAAHKRRVPPFDVRAYAMSTDPTLALTPRPVPVGRRLPLAGDEAERFLRIVAGAQAIERHYHLYLWLKGELQEFLPHEILISAWGDFSSWSLKLDIISALPGVRTGKLSECSIDDFLGALYARWTNQGRQPLVLKPAEVLAEPLTCRCGLHGALREMRWLLVHGVHDARDGHDSLYVALNRTAFAKGALKERLPVLVDALMGQIDMAFRRVKAMPVRAAKGGEKDWLDLSGREQEILDGICRGKSNSDIAAALDISPFTVKNHVQRIFRKIGVNNRTQAATKYNSALQELRRFLTP